MIKKWLAMFMVLALALGAVACGNSNNGQQANDSGNVADDSGSAAGGQEESDADASDAAQ